MPRLAVLVPLIAAALFLGYAVDDAVDTRARIEEDEKADEDVNCDGTTMTRRDCLLLRVVGGERSISSFLVQLPVPFLFGTLYLLAGLAGGLVGSFLRLAGLRPPMEDATLEACLVLAGGIAGLVACGLLIMPGVNTVSSFISQSPGDLTALRRGYVVAVLAGLYTATFFESAETVLRRILEPHGERTCS